MKTCLAIITHRQAAPTVDAFMPQWRKLGIPLIGCYPGERIEDAERWDHTFQVGRSARTGLPVFERFLSTCRGLHHMDFDRFIVAEYDTLNLSTDLPTFRHGKVTSCLSAASEEILCSLSPWCMDREAMRLLIAAMERQLEEDPHCAKAEGLLDRWIGEVMQRENVPIAYCDNALGYPWNEGCDEKIRRLGFKWIHGWKTRKEFGDLWPL